MRHERRLLAIQDPAPSIPARFRLYHGGTAKRGYLVTQDPNSNAYVGDYVYFSSLKRYAREYLQRRRRVPATLFVIDARYLPAGTRVFRNTQTAWPPRSVMGRIFDLIDMQRELKSWIETLQRSSARTMLEPAAPQEVRSKVTGWLRVIWRLPRISRKPRSLPVVSARVLRVLRSYFDRLLGPGSGAGLAALAPLEEACACSDRWSNVVLFLLETYGTLDLSGSDLRSARGRYRREWLAEFSAPLTASTLDEMRQLGVADDLRTASTDPDRLDELAATAFNGVIAIVPGAIPVLAAGARRRTKRKGT
jgi:hypothetical protein